MSNVIALNRSRQAKGIKFKEMDLLPIMNLFSVLIPFLISISVFQKIGVVAIELPEANPTYDDIVPPQGSELELSVIMTGEQIQVWSSRGALPPIAYTSQPSVTDSGSQDLWVQGSRSNAYDSLGKQLQQLSLRTADLPDGDRVSVVAADSMAFDRLVHIMDAARDNGFPKISLAKIGWGG
jgi:biopolymer transport protein ExbD